MQLSFRCYRVVATGFCFVVFGIGGLLLPLFFFPMQRVLIHHPLRRKRSARFAVHLAFKLFVRLMSAVGVIKFDVPSKELLASSNGKVLISNHPTLIDVVVLISLLPQADCVVKAGLLRNPFMRGVINAAGYISNADPVELLEDCTASLKQGNTLIIFPEGTRTTPGQLFRLQRGAANIALHSGCNFLVCCICCSPATLTKQCSWYQVPLQQAKLAVSVVREWEVASYCADASRTRASRLLTQDLENFFNQELMQHGTT